MSNPLALAAVTATLRNLLLRVATPFPSETDSDLSDTEVTTLPLDKAGLQEDHNQINLFLYQVAPNAAGRNLDGRGNPGKPPALALDLFYMVTVYGRNTSDILSQRLLGRAMSLLHSYAILLPSEIATALSGTDLQGQSERVRVTPHHMANEEMVRMWSTFQVKYRLSVVYRVGPILIDHEQTTTDQPVPQRVVVNVNSNPGSSS